MSTAAWRSIRINPEVCKGCNVCVEVCPNDVYAPNPEKGKPPIIMFPEECGCRSWGITYVCIMDCPLREKGAISVYAPYYLRDRVKR